MKNKLSFSLFAFFSVIGSASSFVANGRSYHTTTSNQTPHLSPTTLNLTPRKILIVGGGIGGISSAFDAKHILRPTDEITVVSDRELFQFTPSNPWVAVSRRTPEDISLPLKSILPKHGINFVHGRAEHLYPKTNELSLEDGTKLEYDYLIIATGPRLAFDEIPGADKSTVSVCTTPHASSTAKKVDELVKDPGAIVIGATQGASCFGPAYEYALLLRWELERRGGQELLKKCPMTFITPEPHIGHLGVKSAGSGAEGSQAILENLLKERGFKTYANCRVNSITPTHISVTKVDERNTFHIPSKFTMLIPPFRGQHVWKKVPNLTDEKGMISINEYQQSTAYPNIFGVGVCVSIPPVEDTLVPTGAPKTGFMIESQGTAAVKNIKTIIEFEEENDTSRLLSNDCTKPELHHVPLLNGLCITDFGGDGAIFVTMPQYPPRHTDVTLHGKMATLAKLAFEKYFLYKVEHGDTDPFYEKYMLHLIGIDRVKEK
mmetsp:Transcript_4603/g.10213  ORF Transcript_4603/g.10213 Transcript_4603/m.10213 type:complete len:490 (+) Transcript_4603:96-1565(+)